MTDHLNHASLLPPTRTPLLIEVAGQLVKAQRTTHVRKRGDELEYVTEQGFTIHGRYRWTYP